MDGGTEGVADAEFHEAGDELGAAAEEDGEAKDSLVGADAAVKGVGAGEAALCVSTVIGGCDGVEGLPDAALVEAEDKGGQGEADEAEGTGVGNLEEGRIVHLRDGGLERLGGGVVGLHIIAGGRIAVGVLAIAVGILLVMASISRWDLLGCHVG